MISKIWYKNPFKQCMIKGDLLTFWQDRFRYLKSNIIRRRINHKKWMEHYRFLYNGCNGVKLPLTVKQQYEIWSKGRLNGIDMRDYMD